MYSRPHTCTLCVCACACACACARVCVLLLNQVVTLLIKSITPIVWFTIKLWRWQGVGYAMIPHLYLLLAYEFAQRLFPKNIGMYTVFFFPSLFLKFNSRTLLLPTPTDTHTHCPDKPFGLSNVCRLLAAACFAVSTVMLTACALS